MISKAMILLTMVMVLPKIGVTEGERLGSVSLETMTKMVDASRIRSIADSIGVPPAIMWSIAWEESGTGYKGNKVYGHGTRLCRAVGRMQINPCAGWSKLGSECLRANLTDYDDNVICSAKILRYMHEKMSWPDVIRHYNGRGPKAYAYKHRVLRRIKMLTLSIPVTVR